jgi:hypothetical protein
MSASAASLTRAAERVPRWSSTGHARARPHRSPALLSTPHSSQRAIVMGAQAKPISPTIGRNHPMDAPPRQTATSIAAVKSP